jgi:hypothetical protein
MRFKLSHGSGARKRRFISFMYRKRHSALRILPQTNQDFAYFFFTMTCGRSPLRAWKIMD